MEDRNYIMIDGVRYHADRPACCGSCEYNQPNFKYRTCLFVRCPMDKTRRTLRDKPLRKDKFSA